MKLFYCLGTAALLATSGCYGLQSDSAYPDYESDEVRERLLSPENEEDPSISLDSFVIKDEACEGMNVHGQTRPIAQDDFARHIKARGNLYWFEFPGDDPEDGDVVRLRLAVLSTAEEAADELHASLLQHGPGWWGLRRSNLSILAPKAGIDDAVAFALKYKLICWGMMSYTDRDDVHVVPGPYMEL